jgi:hypothetical protein
VPFLLYCSARAATSGPRGPEAWSRRWRRSKWLLRASCSGGPYTVEETEGLNSWPLPPPRTGLLASRPVTVAVGVPGRGAYRAVDLVAVYIASQRRRRAYAISVHARASGALAVGLGCFGLTVRETPHDPWQWRLVEDAYGRTLAYLYLDADADGRYERLFNEDLMELGLARTTTFNHTYRREFERAREQAEQRGAGLWSACPDVAVP